MKRGIQTYKNKICVVTGAGSGIGRAGVIDLVKQGAKISCCDRDLDSLKETIALSGINEKDVYFEAFDISDRESVENFAKNTYQHFKKIDFVWNNAGISLQQITTEKLSYKNFELVMNINFWGMVYGTKSFLPYLLENPEPTSMVATSSSHGIIATGYMGSYTASKFAIRGLYESMNFELRDTKVKAHLIFPGGVKTGISKNSIGNLDTKFVEKKLNKTLTGDVEKVTQSFLRQIKNGRFRVFGGARSRLYDIVARLWPYHLYHQLQLRFAKHAIEVGEKNSTL